MVPFQADGEFWLPQEPTEQRLGHLEFGYGSAGIHLRLLGLFPGHPFSTGGDEPTVPVIFGLLDNGDLVTLTSSDRGATSSAARGGPMVRERSTCLVTCSRALIWTLGKRRHLTA